MPCDSAAAALISLGALIRGLGNPLANDLGGHYTALTRFARQYLDKCSVCEVRCEPEVKGCGYASEASGKVRYQGRKIYTVSDRSDSERIWFFGQRVHRQLIPQFAFDWQIDGIPPPQLYDQEGALPPPQVYQEFVANSSIVDRNLKSSFSGLCLAGRAAGEKASLEIYGLIRFRIAGEEYSLPNLLTVHGWSRFDISRMTFFNSRRERIDREPYAPTLVVADGDAAFLKVLDRPGFQNSDVIGVIHRLIDRSNLEAVASRIVATQQWYVEDDDLLNKLTDVPKGISVAIVRRRNR